MAVKPTLCQARKLSKSVPMRETAATDCWIGVRALTATDAKFEPQMKRSNDVAPTHPHTHRSTAIALQGKRCGEFKRQLVFKRNDVIDVKTLKNYT
jgi:hypothetical protein